MALTRSSKPGLGSTGVVRFNQWAYEWPDIPKKDRITFHVHFLYLIQCVVSLTLLVVAH